MHVRQALLSNTGTARPALAGSPHTEDQDCSWPINRNRPYFGVLVFAPEMLVRPQRAPGAGDD